jgi:hypothetical protein
MKKVVDELGKWLLKSSGGVEECIAIMAHYFRILQSYFAPLLPLLQAILPLYCPFASYFAPLLLLCKT